MLFQEMTELKLSVNSTCSSCQRIWLSIHMITRYPSPPPGSLLIDQLRISWTQGWIKVCSWPMPGVTTPWKEKGKKCTPPRQSVWQTEAGMRSSILWGKQLLCRTTQEIKKSQQNTRKVAAVKALFNFAKLGIFSQIQPSLIPSLLPLKLEQATFHISAL